MKCKSIIGLYTALAEHELDVRHKGTKALIEDYFYYLGTVSALVDQEVKSCDVYDTCLTDKLDNAMDLLTKLEGYKDNE